MRIARVVRQVIPLGFTVHASRFTPHAITNTSYLYGTDCLASSSGATKTWYTNDGLGSVRRTMADAGTPLGVVNYDPWGTPESGSVPTFGFTGELQDTAAGLVNPRARWYGKPTSVRRQPIELVRC